MCQIWMTQYLFYFKVNSQLLQRQEPSTTKQSRSTNRYSFFSIQLSWAAAGGNVVLPCGFFYKGMRLTALLWLLSFSTAPCRQPSSSTYLPLLPVGSLLPPLIFHCSLLAAFFLHLSSTAPCWQPSPFTCLPLLPVDSLLPPLVFHCSLSTVFSLHLSPTAPC